MPDLWIFPHCIIPTPGARVEFVTAEGEVLVGEYWGGFYIGTKYYQAVKWRRVDG